MAPGDLRQRVEALRGRRATPRVVVVGDAMPDRYPAAADRHPMPALCDTTENLPSDIDEDVVLSLPRELR